MYSVSQNYIAKLKEVSVKHRRIRGSVDNVSFTENDILMDSFSYSDIAVNSSDIRLGGVFISSLSLTFLKSFADNISRGSWRGKVITGTIDLFLGYDNNDQEIWESVPFKPYTIDEANHSILGVDVKAYDAMSKFDKAIQLSTSSGNLYGFASLACQECGVSLGMNVQEMAALPNGDQTLGIYPDNDIETYRDLISWIAVTCGGFATIDRSGALVFRTFSDTPVITLSKDDRYTGGSWSDFQTNYSSITVTNTEDGTESYYAMPTDTGLNLDIGENPLLQYGVQIVKDAQRRAILTAVQNLKYIPFKCSSHIDPCLDLGDVIAFTGGLADTQSKCCVMRIDYKYSKGVTLQGYGKNPALSGAKSSTDKAVAHNSKNAKSYGLSYYTYMNAESISLNDSAETTLYEIKFAVSEQTTVTLWHNVKILSELDSSTQEITFFYYFDGDLETFEPINTYNEDGYHMFNGDYYLLNVEAGGSHTWKVTALIDSGDASIAVGDLRACLMGQRMDATGGSDRDINLEDTYIPLLIGQEVFSPLTESVSISTAHTEDTLYRVTEDGNMRVLENGYDPRVCEGGE